MAKVSISTAGSSAGIWVTNEEGDTVGLVAEDGRGAYLMIQDRGSEFPFAISTDSSHEAHVQIPGPRGTILNMKIFSIEKLVKLVKD